MSKRFSINISRESAMLNEQSDLIEADINEDTEVDLVEVLDPEEVQAEVDEAVSLYEQEKDILKQKEDIERIEDIATSLEDLANIANAIDEISVTDTAMMQTAMNMAVAGTDADATVIVPGMESFTHGNLAAEAIGEKVKNLASAISDMLKNAANSVAKFFRNLVDAMGRSISQMEKLVKQIDSKEGTKTRESITFKNGAYVTTPGGRGIEKADEFVKLQTAGLNKAIQTAKNIKSDDAYTKALTYFTDSIAKGKFDAMTNYTFKGIKSFGERLASTLDSDKYSKEGITGYDFNCGIGSGVFKLETFKTQEDLLTKKIHFGFSAGKKPAVEMSVIDFAKLKNAVAKLTSQIKEVQSVLSGLEMSFGASASKAIEATKNKDIPKGNVKLTRDLLSIQLFFYNFAHIHFGNLAFSLCKGSVAFVSAQAASYK